MFKVTFSILPAQPKVWLTFAILLIKCQVNLVQKSSLEQLPLRHTQIPFTLLMSLKVWLLTRISTLHPIKGVVDEQINLKWFWSVVSFLNTFAVMFISGKLSVDKLKIKYKKISRKNDLQVENCNTLNSLDKETIRIIRWTNCIYLIAKLYSKCIH